MFIARRGQKSESFESFTTLGTISEVKDESSLPGILRTEASELSHVSVGSGSSEDEATTGLLRTKGFSDEFVDFVMRTMKNKSKIILNLIMRLKLLLETQSHLIITTMLE